MGASDFDPFEQLVTAARKIEEQVASTDKILDDFLRGREALDRQFDALAAANGILDDFIKGREAFARQIDALSKGQDALDGVVERMKKVDEFFSNKITAHESKQN